MDIEKTSGKAAYGSKFEQRDPWTEPQLNLRWNWICGAESLWIYSLTFNILFV